MIRRRRRIIVVVMALLIYTKLITIIVKLVMIMMLALVGRHYSSNATCLMNAGLVCFLRQCLSYRPD